MSEAITSSAAPVAAPSPESSNSELEGQEGQALEGVDAPLEAAKKPPVEAPKSNKKKYDVKVDGQTESLELDLDNEQEMIKHLQFSKAAQKRMQEKAELQRGVEEFMDILRTDPGKILSDPRLQIPEEVRQKLAQSIINREIEEMNKSPEQKDKEKIQKEYEQLKKEVEEAKSARDKAEFQALQEKHAVQLDADMSEAIQSAGLPKNARTIKHMAEALSFCIQNNIDMSAKDLAPLIKKQTLAEFKEMIGSLADDDFEDWVGKERLTNMRKKRVAAATAKPVSTSNIKPTGSSAATDEPKKVKANDFFNKLGRY